MGTEDHLRSTESSQQRFSFFKRLLKIGKAVDGKPAGIVEEAQTGSKPAGSGAPPISAIEPAPAGEPVTTPISTLATAPFQPVENTPPAKSVSAAETFTVPVSAPAAPEVAQIPQSAKVVWENKPAKALWYPPDFQVKLPAIEYHQYQDNYSTDRRAANGWHIVGATRRGKKHAHDATHREDAYAIETTQKFTVLAMADGAGAYPFSRLGSQYATTELVHHLSAQLTSTVEKCSGLAHVQFLDYLAEHMEKSILHVIDTLVNYADKNGVKPQDFRCTLLSALFYHDDKYPVVLLNQIGDGAICTYNKQTEEIRKFGGEGESGEHSGEVSRFVPDEASKKIDFHILPPERMKEVDCLMLCSDGIEDPFFPMEKNSVHIFRQFYHGVKEAELADLGITQVPQPSVFNHSTEGANLESWLTFDKRGESDDRTVLVMFRGRD